MELLVQSTASKLWHIPMKPSAPFTLFVVTGGLSAAGAFPLHASSAPSIRIARGEGLESRKAAPFASFLSAVGDFESTESFADSKLKKRSFRTFSRYLEVECWSNPSLRSLETVLVRFCCVLCL